MRIALFPGSFDPITLGHEEIIRRAIPLFDKIIVGIGVNSQKKTMFTLEQRFDFINRVFDDAPTVETTEFQGLTVDYARANGIGFLLRGLRNGNDLEYEKPIALINRQLNSELETIFMISTGATAHISSTLVREIIKYNGDLNGLVPEELVELIPKLRQT